MVAGDGGEPVGVTAPLALGRPFRPQARPVVVQALVTAAGLAESFLARDRLEAPVAQQPDGDFLAQIEELGTGRGRRSRVLLGLDAGVSGNRSVAGGFALIAFAYLGSGCG